MQWGFSVAGGEQLSTDGTGKPISGCASCEEMNSDNGHFYLLNGPSSPSAGTGQAGMNAHTQQVQLVTAKATQSLA